MTEHRLPGVLTSAEFAVVRLVGHVQVAHVDELLCTEPDCAGLVLLARHPDDWQRLTAEQAKALTAAPAAPDRTEPKES